MVCFDDATPTGMKINQQIGPNTDARMVAVSYYMQSLLSTVVYYHLTAVWDIT